MLDRVLRVTRFDPTHSQTVKTEPVLGQKAGWFINVLFDISSTSIRAGR